MKDSDSVSNNSFLIKGNGTSEVPDHVFFSLIDSDKLVGEILASRDDLYEEKTFSPNTMAESTTNSVISINQSTCNNASLLNNPDVLLPLYEPSYYVKKQAEEHNVEIEKTIEEEIQKLEKILKTYSDDERIEKLDEELYAFSSLPHASFSFGNVIQSLEKRIIDFPDRLAALCMGLSRYDYSDKFINRWGYCFLATIINIKNQDEQLLESAVCLIENWKNEELVGLLKHLQVGTPWLRLYIEDVIGEEE